MGLIDLGKLDVKSIIIYSVLGGLLIYLVIKLPNWIKEKNKEITLKGFFNSKYINPSTIKNYPNFVSSIPLEKFKEFAKTIHRGTYWLIDNTEETIGIFKYLPTKLDVAKLANVYFNEYGTDIGGDINSDLREKYELQLSEILNKKPLE